MLKIGKITTYSKLQRRTTYGDSKNEPSYCILKLLNEGGRCHVLL